MCLKHFLFSLVVYIIKKKLCDFELTTKCIRWVCTMLLSSVWQLVFFFLYMSGTLSIRAYVCTCVYAHIIDGQGCTLLWSSSVGLCLNICNYLITSYLHLKITICHFEDISRKGHVILLLSETTKQLFHQQKIDYTVLGFWLKSIMYVWRNAINWKCTLFDILVWVRIVAINEKQFTIYEGSDLYCDDLQWVRYAAMYL